MIVLVPFSEGRSLREGNDKHEPGGSAKGGQFARKDSGGAFTEDVSDTLKHTNFYQGVYYFVRGDAEAIAGKLTVPGTVEQQHRGFVVRDGNGALIGPAPTEAKEGLSLVTGTDWSGTGWSREFDTPDDYYYHVTLEPQAKRIIKDQALRGGNAGFMGRAEPSSHSTGRTFVTDRNGVFFWASRVEDHANDKYDDPPPIAVVRIPKSAVTNVEIDEAGTRDARAPAYFIRGGVKLK